MKKLTYLFLLVINGLVLKAAAPDTSGIPAKWKNESIILLNYEYSYTVKASKGTEEIRAIYYIRDNWGLELVSKLNLPSEVESADNHIGTVYKKNGGTIEITKEHLIPQNEKIDFKGRGKKSFSLEAQTGQKLAVPSLEVGDILEISYENERPSYPEVVLLTSKFPMKKFRASVEFGSDNDGYYTTYTNNHKARLFNAPGVTPKEINDHRVLVEMENVDKYKEEILNDNLTQIPYVLIQRISSNATYDKDFSGMSASEVKTTQEALVQTIYYRWDDEQRHFASKINSALMSKYPKIKDTLAFANDVYYMYRDLVGGDFVFSGYSNSGYRGDAFFVNVMSRVLFARGINYRVFIAQADHYGAAKKMNDFIDMNYGIVIPSRNYYFFNPLYNITPGNVPSYFEGQENITFNANKHFKKAKFRWLIALSGLAVVSASVGVWPILASTTAAIALYGIQSQVDKSHKKYDFRTGRFPSFKPATNQVVSNITVKSINTSDNTLDIETRDAFYGKMKISEMKKINEVSASFYGMEKNPYKKMLRQVTKEEKDNKKKEEETKRVKDMFSDDLAEDGFWVKNVKSYEFTQSNFFDAAKPLEHVRSFQAKDLAWSAENYIIVRAGNLIGSQLIVPEKSKGRTQDFYIPYQKQYEKNIIIPIPEGYAPQNLDEFNVSRETACGKFVAKASVEGNKITIKTIKQYQFQFYDKEDAQDVYSFLYLAEQYRDKKLIFKKG